MFDPDYPPASAEIESAPLRAQFNALFDLIQERAHGIPGVNTLELTPDAEYSQAQQQEVVATLNALITALKGS
ncbi:MAG TPA: hypothetical protein DIT64_06945 [Verrucomicrobiales bacterium]|nr:hypothetical protein [Verrucomicrobiales bacterium]